MFRSEFWSRSLCCPQHTLWMELIEKTKNLLRNPSAYLAPRQLMDVQFKVKLFEGLNVYNTSPVTAISLCKPSPIYLHYLLLWTYSVNPIQFGHTVTVHVQHRWQMNINKLLHIFKHVRLTMDTYRMFNRRDLSKPNGYFYGYGIIVQTDTAFTLVGICELLVK